jgi:hypothetical protein
MVGMDPGLANPKEGLDLTKISWILKWADGSNLTTSEWQFDKVKNILSLSLH